MFRRKRENDAFLYIRDREDQSVTHAKLFNIKCEFFGFIGDLILETINQ